MKKLFTLFFVLFIYSSQGDEHFNWGGGIKSDILMFDDLPTEFSRSSEQPLPDYNISRNITTLWGEYSFNKDLSFRLGLLNSFREYFNGETPQNDYSFPSEILINEAYFDFKNLFGERFNIRLGRQGLKYGKGRVVFEPNPLDAVRTSFFDAVKVTLTLDNNEIDFIAFKNNDFNSFVINREPRRLANDDIHGAIIYGHNNINERFPFEYYYLFTSENFDERRESHTFGGRFMPSFIEKLKGELELAGQTGKVGNDDQTGYLLFASLSYQMSFGKFHPELSAGYYYLSGDDPDTDKNESWNGALAGWAQFSNLMIISNIGNDQGFSRYNNLSSPFIELSFPVFDGRLKFSYWNLRADEEGANADLGRERGDLFMVKLDYPITKKLDLEIISEWLEIGNYYPDEMNDAHFLRVRFKYTF